MSIGSPPPPEKGVTSNLPNRTRNAWLGPALLIALLVAIGAVAWRSLRTSDTLPPHDATARDHRAEVDAPREPVVEDPSLSERLLAAAAAAQREVSVTAHVATASRAEVKSLELIGGFGSPPTASRDASWSLRSGEFADDGSVKVSIPAAWPRLRAMRIVRRDGAFDLRRDLPLVGGDLDLGELPLPKGGPIAGRVASRDGDRLTGARVAVFGIADELIPGLPEDGAIAVATTGAEGVFSFPSLSERHVRVEVSGVPGRANAVVPDAEIWGPSLEFALPAAASIHGRLVDVAGQPVEGGRLLARMAGPREASAQRGAPTGRDGAFALDALMPGYYSLIAVADGFAPRSIALAHTDVEGLTIQLDRLASARLAFVNAPARLETPVVWRTVEPLGATYRRTSSAEVAWCNGRDLVVEGIAPGRQALELTLPGTAPIVTSVATFSPNQTTELGTFSLQLGGALLLRVTDGDGRPLRARIALAAPQWSTKTPRLDPFALDHDERVTDGDGRCLWPDLPAGRRVVTARALAGSLADANGADASAEVEIPASGCIEVAPLVIQPAGSVAGRVRARRGAPLAGMLVEVEGGGTKRSTTTDFDGRYEVRGLPPGRYVVTVVRRDESPPTDLEAALAPRENPTASVEVSVGKTTPRDFELDLD